MLFLPLPVSQLCPFSVLFLLLPVSQLCPFTPATQCAIPTTSCITARPFTIASPVGNTCHCLCHSIAPSPLPIQCAIPAAPASQLCSLPLLVQWAICHYMHQNYALFHGPFSAPFLPATLCIIVVGMPHHCQFSATSLALPVSQQWVCPITASSVLHHCYCLHHSNRYVPSLPLPVSQP
jgi:hypothetical protein